MPGASSSPPPRPSGGAVDHLFGDYTTKKIWTLRFDASGNLVRAPESPPFGSDIGGGNLAKYLQLGAHGKFGPPTTEELSTPDGAGRYNHFVG
ncbi:hypothetical protein [Saccharopolyspora sp. ASAGF58]|uniref:hypothetical protein n=1 Tax=Saccharopolyspora sp. ASAGF58 TaxID=2719023 RepID=UPI0035300EF8